MAESKNPPAVAREEYWWGYVLHNARGCILLTKDPVKQSLPVECKRLSDGRFELTVLWPDEETKRRRASEAYQQALEKERKELAELPQSHEQYRKHCAHQAARMVEIVKDVYCATPHGGYVYAPEVLEELEARIEEVRDLLLHGRSVFLPEARKARITEIKAKTAAADPELRGFIERLTASLSAGAEVPDASPRER